MLRVVSLLPSATEILALIGGGKLLVGRSHECDFPKELSAVPVVTSSCLSFTTSAAVDEEVRTAKAEGTDLYTIDTALLQQLRPDIIFTQDICTVCAIAAGTVHRAAAMLDPPPRVVALNPADLEDVLADLAKVGEAVGMQAEAEAARAKLQARVDAAVADAKDARRRSSSRQGAPSVAFIEWADPIYVGGHWTPQLIEMAGGAHPLNPAGKGGEAGAGAGKSFAVSAGAVEASSPDILIMSPCGLTLEQTEAEAFALLERPEDEGWFKRVRAVRDGRVALVDGNEAHEGARVPLGLEKFPWKPFDRSVRPPGLPPPPSVLLTTGSAPVENGAGENGAMGGHVKGENGAVGGGGGGEHKRKWSAPVGGFPADIEECHRQAMDRNEDMYTDPATGFLVFTEKAAKNRGSCCGRGCRHCPFAHWNVPEQQRRNVPATPLLLPPRKPSATKEGPRPLEVVFWNGGADSFIALRMRQQAQKETPSSSLAADIVLLTTFDPHTGTVLEGKIKVSAVIDQSRKLGTHLLLVPVQSVQGSSVQGEGEGEGDARYVLAIQAALTEVARAFGIAPEEMAQRVSLVFGQLHLADVRDWHVKHLGALGTRCDFPVFGLPYPALLNLLFEAGPGVEVEISAVSSRAKGVVKVGQRYTRQLAEDLMKKGAVDALGEHGEFHTEMCFSDDYEAA
ncbi:hypothetical protein T484DRAFT_1898261 [Baffinella frigidus]|nr:hypothetical protein T484DRAFT_1898261 [Cryptophyta sp. CCMP2293]